MRNNQDSFRTHESTKYKGFGWSGSYIFRSNEYGPSMSLDLKN